MSKSPLEGIKAAVLESEATATAGLPLQGAIGLRPAADIMRLARLGSFHSSRLSFLRVMLRRMHNESWQFSRPVWRIDDDGYGIATYQLQGPNRSYTLIAFSHKLNDADRSDRVIAEAWDATFTLFDGIPEEADLTRLKQHVPKQEGARLQQSELTLSRANKSVRLFNYVIDCLSQGLQPDAEKLAPVGYLMRTTAVYGAGKFGAADRQQWMQRPEFNGSFQPEMMSVWMIRTFTIDLVNHIAQARAAEKAVTLNADTRRSLGVGNSTGLGMAPFLINHPVLLHQWIMARETALARVRNMRALSTAQLHDKITHLLQLLQLNHQIANEWQSEHELQQQKIADLLSGINNLSTYLESPEGQNALSQAEKPWNDLFLSVRNEQGLEAQELLVSLLIELYPENVDDLAASMTANEAEEFHLDGRMPLHDFAELTSNLYDWALIKDFDQPDNIARVWYVSEEKLEPRLGERFEEMLEPYEQPLSPARDIVQLRADLALFMNQDEQSTQTLAHFLLLNPQHRHSARRVLSVARYPYAELRDNTIGANMLPIDMLRCKLSFFGATKFDPRSDRWLRITLFQHAPYPDEINTRDPDQLVQAF